MACARAWPDDGVLGGFQLKLLPGTGSELLEGREVTLSLPFLKDHVDVDAVAFSALDVSAPKYLLGGGAVDRSRGRVRACTRTSEDETQGLLQIDLCQSTA